MEINRNNIVQLINDFYTRPDKDYGQNFLIDPNLSQKIVESLDISKDENVLEVGPGMGSLTHFISNYDCSYVGVDIDERMINFLNFNYKNDNMTFMQRDIRKFDLSNFDKIISNIPYNITTELISFVLLNTDKCKKMVLMCQSETVRHFIDISGKEYGPVSVLIHLLGNIKTLFTVKPGSFYPSPKCNSTVFEINIKSDVDRKIVRETYSFCKKMFLNRRKTILNNLLNNLKDKDLALSILKHSGISETKRPEEIKPGEYLEFYKCYVKEKNI